jgi:hypothetical protein
MAEEFNREEEDSSQAKPKFNFALDVLKNAEETMRMIRANDSQQERCPKIRQGIKLALIKDYFIIISALLLPEFTEKYMFIIKLKMKESFIKVSSTKSIKILEYCDEFEILLNRCLIDLRIELKNEGYCMPSEDESGMF